MSQSNRDPIRRPDMFAVCGWFLLAAAGQLALRIGLNALIAWAAGRSVDIRLPAQAAYALLFQLGILALPVLYYAQSEPEMAQSMGLTPAQPGLVTFAVLMGVGAVPACQLITGWWMALIQALGGIITGGAAVPGNGPALAQSLLLSAALPAFCEELLFRGGLLAGWGRYGAKKALLITTLLFAALHGAVAGLPGQLLMGFVLGYVALRGGSLWPAVAAHLSYNAFSLLAAYFLNFDLAGSVTRLVYYPQLLWVLIGDTVGCVGLVFMTMYIYRSMCKKRGIVPVVMRQEPAPLDGQETLLLMAGLFTAGVSLVSDILLTANIL